jgi:spermidine synthase
LPISNIFRLLLGISPFASMLGYMTPLLVDRWSAGEPGRAGLAYAVNIAGCILGPLTAGFLLLPLLDERWVLYLFALPWFVLSIVAGNKQVSLKYYWQKTALTTALAALVLASIAQIPGYLGYYGNNITSRLLRDHTATVIATGQGMNKYLYVNGYGMTTLTPITKVMAHLPLAFLDHTPENALVICFGMGTSYRSLLSWGIDVTAIELIPSVPLLFGFFHADATELLKSPRSHIVIDDGRRYLERTAEQYDVITIDPPPPVAAAGSSLLYSKEFYTIAKQRLRADGILQQWLPAADATVQVAVTRAILESFQYVRIFGEGYGYHFIASNRPIPVRTAAELADRMPANAKADLVEWLKHGTAEQKLAYLLRHEISPYDIVARKPEGTALQDDRPVNEYYLLRQMD